MAKLLSKKEIAKDIWDFTIYAPEIADKATAGQFVNVYTNDKSKLLPRPISICKIKRREGTLRIVFRIAGEGTREISAFEEGAEIRIMGPLGNGFFEEEAKTAVLLGGGIGIPPMLGLAEKLKSEGCRVIAVLGYRDRDTFLANEFEKFGEVVIASDDGSVGYHGNVCQALDKMFDEEKLDAGEGICLYACGPIPMQRGVKALAERRGLVAQLSLEERMACGIGACLGCVCKSTEKDHHSNVNNKRVCKDGPVFYAQDIDLN